MDTLRLIVETLQVVAIGAAVYVLIINVKQLKLQREIFQIDLFDRIQNKFDFAYGKHIETKGMGDKEREDSLYRLMNVYEYFSFYANKGLLPGHIIEYYKYSLVECCDEASTYPGFKRFYEGRDYPFFEIKQLYEKFSDKPWPLN